MSALILIAFGCAGRPVVETASAEQNRLVDRGADGDREVVDGPGMFSGPTGGYEISLKDLLLRAKRDRSWAGGEPDGPE